MAQLTITADNGESITLIVSPADALALLMEYSNKYPNAIKSNLTIGQFISRWTEANETQAEGRFRRIKRLIDET